MTLTKADIAERLFQEVGITKRDANEMIELFFHYICTALEKGQPVKLSGFGNFELHDKKQRPGRNPRTGEAVPVSARRVVTFRCGQKLKARVEKYAGRESKDYVHKQKE
ncbi:MAG: integration host factor subunit alpha [Gammaproteobacteria bacterium RIFCSPHIGHO2_12_FULL_45_9]|nr:MAG: integration host factor subunit alpha [Gammaproteobacteria bacterium RIFCSPHIGHO2_12_FULL_45_9]